MEFDCLMTVYLYIFRLIYIHKEECSAIKRLKAHLIEDKGIDASFLKRVPEDLLESYSFPKDQTVLVIDDFHSESVASRALANLLYDLSSVVTHHHGLYVFYSLQSFDIIKKQSKLNNVFLNSTHIVFFRTAHDAKSIKRYLGNYEIALKSSVDLWHIFQKYIQTKRFAYMLICVSPRCERQTVYSNVLLRDDGPMLSFHESDGEDDHMEQKT